MTHSYQETDDMTHLTGLIVRHTPAGLADAIVAHIRALELRAARIRAALFGASTLATSVAAGGALWYAGIEFSNSTFMQYASLVLTDGGSVVPYWKEFTLTLLESLPVLDTLLVFSALFAVTWSGTKLLYYIGKTFTHQYA